jgi:alkylated DNA repair dioxygenase AlkB
MPAPNRYKLLPLGLTDAELLFCEQVDLSTDPNQLLQELISDSQWQEETVSMFGKTYKQPRLIAWYGDPGTEYTYSGVRHEPLPWTETLARLRDRLEQLTDSKYNSVLLNYYRDGSDSMGLHADDEPELGDAPVIASLSLGEQRTLYFRHRSRSDLETFNLPLPNASLLVMRGGTQRHWKHGIRKSRRPLGPRVNLTFRWVYPGEP